MSISVRRQRGTGVSTVGAAIQQADDSLKVMLGRWKCISTYNKIHYISSSAFVPGTGAEDECESPASA